MLFSSLVVLAVTVSLSSCQFTPAVGDQKFSFVSTNHDVEWSRPVPFYILLHVIGVSCGEGDHIDTFNICDLRGRTVIGAGQGGGGLTNRKLAEVAGVEQAIVGFRMQTCGQGGDTCKHQEPIYVDVMQPYVALNGGVLPER